MDAHCTWVGQAQRSYSSSHDRGNPATSVIAIIQNAMEDNRAKRIKPRDPGKIEKECPAGMGLFQALGNRLDQISLNSRPRTR